MLKCCLHLNCFHVEVLFTPELYFYVEVLFALALCFYDEVLCAPELYFYVDMLFASELCFCVEVLFTPELCFCVEVLFTPELCFCVEVLVTPECVSTLKCCLFDQAIVSTSLCQSSMMNKHEFMTWLISVVWLYCIFTNFGVKLFGQTWILRRHLVLQPSIIKSALRGIGD